MAYKMIQFRALDRGAIIYRFFLISKTRVKLMQWRRVSFPAQHAEEAPANKERQITSVIKTIDDTDSQTVVYRRRYYGAMLTDCFE